MSLKDRAKQSPRGLKSKSMRRVRLIFLSMLLVYAYVSYQKFEVIRLNSGRKVVVYLQGQSEWVYQKSDILWFEFIQTKRSKMMILIAASESEVEIREGALYVDGLMNSQTVGFFSDVPDKRYDTLKRGEVFLVEDTRDARTSQRHLDGVYQIKDLKAKGKVFFEF